MPKGTQLLSRGTWHRRPRLPRPSHLLTRLHVIQSLRKRPTDRLLCVCMCMHVCVDVCVCACTHTWPHVLGKHTVLPSMTCSRREGGKGCRRLHHPLCPWGHGRVCWATSFTSIWPRVCAHMPAAGKAAVPGGTRSAFLGKEAGEGGTHPTMDNNGPKDRTGRAGGGAASAWHWAVCLAPAGPSHVGPPGRSCHSA